MPDARLSRFRIVERLGEGGMGTVYRAQDERLGRTLAIKTLRQGASLDSGQRERLVREARAASALNHPNIVTVYDIDQDPESGLEYIAMEYVEGEPLSALVARRECGIDLVLEIGQALASALAAAHAAGIVHRDLKPANVMRSSSGHVKLLDFGLAKQAASRAAAQEQTVEAPLTGEGMVVGTPAYMAPEQIEGRPLDARSDIFALGLLLHELACGARPFQADSDQSLMVAILRDPPQPLARRCPQAPAALCRLIETCLNKDPARRPQAAEVLAELGRIDAAWRRRHTLAARLRQPRVLWPLLGLSMVLSTLFAAHWWQARRSAQELASGLQTLQMLTRNEQVFEAWVLARHLLAEHPQDPRPVEWLEEHTLAIPLLSDPPGAQTWIKPYASPQTEWYPLGLAQQESVRLPRIHLRWRLELPGHAPLFMSSPGFLPPLSMTPLEEQAAGMLRVPAGPLGHSWLPPRIIDGFSLARTEVSNREYQEFVDADGYLREEFWLEPILVDGQTLPFQASRALFRDSTGRPAPAGWELGRHPDGKGDHPVAGVSWYEAGAYARFRGASLPTAYHWLHAAGFAIHSDVLGLGNFQSAASVAVGSRDASSPYGHEDLAGNVAEWTATASEGRRILLGGSFATPSYLYHNIDAEDPLRRAPHIGMRLALLAAQPDPDQLELTLAETGIFPDPVSDVAFEAIARIYAYDPPAGEGSLERVREQEHWRLETWLLPAAYGDERFRVHLFLPRNSAPPWQLVMHAPSSAALFLTDSRDALTGEFSFLVRSGRAVAFPVYFGTMERRLPPNAGPSLRRSLLSNWVRDASTTLDYLLARPDIDAERVGYFGFSLGAYAGTFVLALDPRFRAAVQQATGLTSQERPPEANAINFLPRVRLPVLFIGGRDDFVNPLENSQKPYFERLGSDPAMKRHHVFDGGHVPDRPQEIMGVVIDWFDQHLGPVQRVSPPRE